MEDLLMSAEEWGKTIESHSCKMRFIDGDGQKTFLFPSLTEFVLIWR